MANQIVLRFDNADDFQRVFQFLRDNGLDKFAFAPQKKSKAGFEPTKFRRAGFSKGRFVMSADFNQPLDDFKEYM